MKGGSLPCEPAIRLARFPLHSRFVADARQIRHPISIPHGARESGFRFMDPTTLRHLGSGFSGNRAAPRMRLMTLLFISTWSCLATAQEVVRTGPETEKRFPPIRVPPQFKATLF